MIVVAHRNEPEGLHAAFSRLAGGHEHFCHTVYGTRLRLEADFDEVASLEGACHVQQTTGGGNGLEVGSGALAVV